MKPQAIAVMVLTALTLFAATAATAQSTAVLTVSNGTAPASKITLPSDMPMMLLRQSFAEVLKQSGLTFEAWANACRVGGPMCAQGMQGVVPALAAAAIIQGPEVKFDPVPPGTYYLFALGAVAKDAVIWDVKVDLRGGPAAVRLDERNIAMSTAAVPVRAETTPARAAAAPAAAAPPAASPPAPVPAARAVDPSIAKARAAKVDTKVFGIQLGEPLSLPTCDLLGGFLTPGVTASPACLTDMSGANLVAAFLPADLNNALNAALNSTTMIQLNADTCPTWVSGCSAMAMVYEGNFVGVLITTKGRGVEQATGTELRGKYGAPTSSKVGSITPDVGNPFTITDLVWALPGLHVEFQPVRRMEDDDSRVKTNEGLVIIETEQEYQRRQSTAKQKTKPKL